jgi:hypothetical protein
MKRNFPNRNHWRAYYLLRLGALVLFTALPAQGAPFQQPKAQMPVSGMPQSQKPAVLSMRVDEGRVTATIMDSPLQNVLADLAARTGIIFEVRSQENPLVSVNLHRVTLQEAIQRIAPASNTIYFYGKKQGASDRITLVRLFPRSGTSSQPSILYLGTGAITKSNYSADSPLQ